MARIVLCDNYCWRDLGHLQVDRQVVAEMKIEVKDLLHWGQTIIVGICIGYYIANSQWISALSDGHKNMTAEQDGKKIIKTIAKEIKNR